MDEAFDKSIQDKIDEYYAPLIKINEQINLLKNEINSNPGTPWNPSEDMSIGSLPFTNEDQAGDKREYQRMLTSLTTTGGGGKVKRKISRKKNKPYRLRSKKRKSNTKGLNYSQGKIKTKKI